MAWVRLDDQFPQHPKVSQVGPLGVALQVAGLCYCNQHLTDGFIPWTVARTLLCWQFCDGGKRVTIAVSSGMRGDDVDSDYVIGLLVQSGMWDEVDGGYQIHDYLTYQPSKAEVEADRLAKIEAGRAGGQASAQARAKASAQAQSKQNPTPVPDPVPKPSEKETPNGVSKDALTLGEFKNVKMTGDEQKKLQERFGERDAASWIEELSIAKASKGYKSKSDYATILSWSRRRQSTTTPLPPFKGPKQKAGGQVGIMEPSDYRRGRDADLLDAHAQLRTEAKAAGFDSVPAYIQHLDEERLRNVVSETDSEQGETQLEEQSQGPGGRTPGMGAAADSEVEADVAPNVAAEKGVNQ